MLSVAIVKLLHSMVEDQHCQEFLRLGSRHVRVTIYCLFHWIILKIKVDNVGKSLIVPNMQLTPNKHLQLFLLLLSLAKGVLFFKLRLNVLESD